MRRFLTSIDRFTLILVAAIALASLAPASGDAAALVKTLAVLSVMLLFFLQGARLPREAIIAGLTHWRLHLLVLAASFVLFPLIGLAVAPLASASGLHHALVSGLIFLCCLPSTVQSSIAFTSMARGNVAAAICAAAASNLLGIFVTPLLAGLLLSAHGGVSFSTFSTLILVLLAPFAAGQLLRPVIGAWVARNSAWLGPIDRAAIVLMVYSAFGAAVLEGMWRRTSPWELALLFGFCGVILTAALAATALGSRRLGFSIEDRIAIIFCGSKKSLVTGVPMASILFAPTIAGPLILPLLIFHQMQLMACAFIAHRYARRDIGSDIKRAPAN